MRLSQACLIGIAALLLGACTDGGLRHLVKPGEGPDEFLITPGKPLQAPEDYSALPAPNPGGSNITDQQPLSDAVVALGGRPQGQSDTIPGSDGSLVNHVSRFGRDGSIRTQLAAEDEDFRRRRARFTRIRLVKEDLFAQIYRNQLLDPFAERDRWQRAGARTPSAPPSVQ